MAREKMRKIIDYIGKEIEETLSMFYEGGYKKGSKEQSEIKEEVSKQKTKTKKDKKSSQEIK